MKFTSDQSLANWLRTDEAEELMKKLPDQVNTAVLSNAHRFYWFEIHHERKLNADWLLGANLHFDGHLGSVWVSLKRKEQGEKVTLASFEVHPFKPVTNPVRIAMQNRLRLLTLPLENWSGKHMPNRCKNFEKGHITFS